MISSMLPSLSSVHAVNSKHSGRVSFFTTKEW
ncbi:Uncharacterised protein [Vibrio cholerae]|nr:Uncharacterised protein [Vibrio cholerae]CSI83366.1 Uncharacterised protein [Vibrio cholerae]